MDANVGIVLYHEKLIKTQDINRYKTVHFFFLNGILSVLSANTES